MNAYGELKAIPQWVGWKEEKRGDKLTKVPKNPRTGKNARSNDPKTWTDAATAWRAAKQHGWDGMGFVFTIKAGIVGIDLDDCLEPTEYGGKRMKPWAKDIYMMMHSFTEKSPSGNGLHIFVRGEIPNSIKKNQSGIEIYNELRYFTVTGEVLYPGPDDKPIQERSRELGALHAALSGPCKPKQPSRSYEGQTLDEKKIEDALRHIPKRMDYYDWLKVLMAVHDAYPNLTGIQLCESWSPGYEGEIEEKFKSFDRTAKDGVTVATLFHMAKQHGWQPRRPVRRTSGYNRHDLRGSL